MLNSRPGRNELIKWDRTDNGEIEIRVKRQDNWKITILSKLFYIPKERKITLDEVGSEVWQMCNGRTTVAQMIDGLSRKYQLNRKEAEVSLLSYLKTLGQKRFIGFAIEKDASARSNSGKKWE